MLTRTWLLLALVAIGALQLVASDPHPSSQFAGTDYGDLIDELRARVEADSYQHDDANPGRMGRVRELLNKIHRDIRREQSAADLIAQTYMTDFVNRNFTLSGTISNTTKWLDAATKRIDFDQKRIANLTVWLHSAPKKIAVQKELVKQFQNKISAGQKIRDTANLRFRNRERQAQDVISATNYVSDQLGGVINSTKRYGASLQGVLNKDNANPKFRALVDSLSMDVVRMRSSDDINKIRATLKKLKDEYSKHLHALTTAEGKWAKIWNAKKAGLTAQLTTSQTKLANMIKSIPDSKAEIKKRAEESSSLSSERPLKVETLTKAKAALARLKLERTPLLAEYMKHQTQRKTQLKLVDSLLDIIHKRYDGNNLST